MVPITRVLYLIISTIAFLANPRDSLVNAFADRHPLLLVSGIGFGVPDIPPSFYVA